MDLRKWLGAWSSPLTRAFNNATDPPLFIPGAFPVLPPIYQAPIIDKTVRIVSHLNAGGDKIRLKFSNLLFDSVARGEGNPPNNVILHITEVRLAKQLNNQTIIPVTNHLITFAGKTEVDIFPGGEVISDPIDFKVSKNNVLITSIYFANSRVNPCAQYFSEVGSFTALAPGNLTQATTFVVDPANALFGSIVLNGIEVRAAPPSKGRAVTCSGLPLKGRTLVCIGDSITGGFGSTLNQFLDYPSQLANRILNPRIGVINQGYDGNQLTNGGSLIPFYNSFVYLGTSGSERLSRDVLNQSNVRYVIILEGINDINNINNNTSGDKIISALTHFARQVKHTNPNIKAFVGTITPFKGFFAWTQDKEDQRQKVNNWIFTNTEFDGVIDFAAAIADPADPLFIRPSYAINITPPTDGLHPNDLGYKAMADAIPLSIFN